MLAIRRLIMPTSHTTLPLYCACLISGLAIGAAAPAQGDVVLHAETRSSAGSGPARVVSHLWLDSERIRMEFEDPAKPGATAIAIFRGDRQLIWTLDSQARSYVQLDRAELARLGERVKQAEQEMRARLPELPPDKRAQAELMLEQMSPGAPVPSEEIVATKQTLEIGGVTCTLHELRIADRRVGEAWAAPWSEVAIDLSDLSALEKLSEFQREMMATLGNAGRATFGGQPFDLLIGFPAFRC
jgi:hypothetical protein